MHPNGRTYIYNGPGAWSLSVEQSYMMLESKVDSRSITFTDSFVNLEKDTRLFVVPGGDAIQIMCKLRAEGQKVTELVHKGSSFLGICAGALSSCKEIISKSSMRPPKTNVDELQKAGKLWVAKSSYPYTFNFYDQSCVARHMVKNVIDPVHTDNFCPVAVRLTDQIFYACHYSGPAFINVPHNVDIIARYDLPVDLVKLVPPAVPNDQNYTLDRSQEIYEESPAAVVALKYGEGQVVLSGIHPEFNPSTFDGEAPKHRFEGKMPKEVAASEASRLMLIEKMFSALKI